MLNRRFLPLIFLVMAIIVLALPVVIKDLYHLHVLITVFLNVVLASSLFIIVTMGEMSLAHSGFVGIGAYASAVLVTKVGLPFWISLPLAGVAAVAVAVIIGFPTLRLTGVYFFLVTFALAQVIKLFFMGFFANIFGGGRGIPGIPPPNSISIPGLFTIDFNDRVPMYLLAAVIMMVSLLAIYQLLHSRVGKIWKSIEQSRGLAQSSGINVMKYKIMAFATACFFAGVVGSFTAHYNAVITPEDFTFASSVNYVIYMVVGGVGSLLGPMVGAPVLTIARELLAAFPYVVGLLFGGVLVVVLLFMPDGFIGLPRQLASFRGAWNPWLCSLVKKLSSL